MVQVFVDVVLLLCLCLLLRISQKDSSSYHFRWSPQLLFNCLFVTFNVLLEETRLLQDGGCHGKSIVKKDALEIHSDYFSVCYQALSLSLVHVQKALFSPYILSSVLIRYIQKRCQRCIVHKQNLCFEFVQPIIVAKQKRRSLLIISFLSCCFSLY